MLTIKWFAGIEAKLIFPISSPTDPIDHTSNVRVSGLKNGNAARRDSWDVINKTKNILSHNSLESLANMTENQLNTDLGYGRPRALDSETEYNTRYNKFELVEKRTIERRGSEELSDRYKIYSWVLFAIQLNAQLNNLIRHFGARTHIHRPSSSSVSLKQDSNAHRDFASTIKERNEHLIRHEKDSDYGYTSSSRFRPIGSDVSGAQAIRVQDIPNGVLGRPVEFESELN